MKNISVNQLLANPELYNEDNYYGFYDWFCKDSSLKGRYTRALNKVKSMVKAGIIDGDAYSVWFKNNCPMVGSTYDDIRFNRLEDDEYMGGFCTASVHKSIKVTATYWLAKEDFKSHDFINFSTMKKTMQRDKISL